MKPRLAFLLPLTLLLAGVALIATAASADDEDEGRAHEQYFEHYEGTKTCLECHRAEAESFFYSQHYQWRGETSELTNTKDEKLGKLNTINDFCTNPRINWIGEVANAEGDVLAKGCSKCHAGRGALPEQKISEEQLLNIDCMICHTPGYRRDLYRNDAGAWEWMPILKDNREGLDYVAHGVGKTSRTTCLRCHSASGGGPNYKRGDLSYALRDCEPSHDVHMASEGHDLSCSECHASANHRVRGRGADLSALDAPDDPLTCTTCHDEAPHAIRALDMHTARVACQTCHIPAFAKDEPTDMFRDWSDGHYDEEAGKHKPRIDLESNVVPVYAWFNGTSRAQLAGAPAKRIESGEVAMMLPEGSLADPRARIYPFKLHRAKLPALDGKEWIVPIITEHFYADGDIDKWVREAAKDYYGIENARFHWVDTIRYMSINHEVQPAKAALGCLDCHGPAGRMEWAALGYEADPLEALLDKTLRPNP